MDELDRNIIRLLYAKGRLSHEQLDQQINLSRPAVHEHIRRMEAQEVIRGYTALVISCLRRETRQPKISKT